MKKKDKVTQKYYRINDHMLLATRMIDKGEIKHFQIEKFYSDVIIPEPDDKKANIDGNNICVGLSEHEAFIVIGDLIKYIESYRKPDEIK